MPVILPFKSGVGDYTFSAVLRDVEYQFRVRWNSREDAWFFDVKEPDLTPIATGIKVVLGAYFAREITHPLFRDGAMVCRIPHGDDRREPGFDDIGGQDARVQVWYFTRAEVVAEIMETLRRRGP